MTDKDTTAEDAVEQDTHGSAQVLEDNLRKARQANRFGHSSDQHWRERAILYLLAHADRAYPRLLDDLRHGVQLPGTIAVIGRFGRGESIPVLEELLERGHESVREAAALALGEHPQSEALDALIRAIDAHDTNTQHAALSGLQTRGDPSVCPKITHLLTSPDASLRWLALHALGKLNCLEPSELTRLARDDPDEQVRALAAKLREHVD